MDSANVLQQMIHSPFAAVPDPGNGGILSVDRNFQVFDIIAKSGVETRTLAAPTRSGLFVTLDCVAIIGGASAVVSVLDSTGATTGTVTLSNPGTSALLQSQVSAWNQTTGIKTFVWQVISINGGLVTTMPLGGIFSSLTASNLTITSGEGVYGNFTLHAGSNIVLDATTGTKIGTATTQKLAFWNATPVVQPTASGVTTGFTAVNTSTVVAAASTFTGNIGATAYTIGDLVAALKTAGLIAS